MFIDGLSFIWDSENWQIDLCSSVHIPVKILSTVRMLQALQGNEMFLLNQK